MFGFKKRPQFTEAEAAGIKMQFEIVFGSNYRERVNQEWAAQSWIKKLWYTLRGQDIHSFWREFDAALSEYEDGYCGEGCVCFTPEGTQVAYSTIEEINKALVL